MENPKNYIIIISRLNIIGIKGIIKVKETRGVTNNISQRKIFSIYHPLKKNKE
jgi:hypothetical protein